MADFVFKPSANAVDDFTGSLEFNTLNPAGTVSVADGTYDIYQKVVSSFQVVDISAQFSVADVGEEPVITAVDGNVSVTIGSGIHAGTYTTRITDGATLTVAMIEAAATPIILPTISGTETVAETLTVIPGVWLYAGADAGDQTFLWVNNTDGDTAETTLTYTLESTDEGDTIKVSESYGGVTIDSANTGSIAASAGASYPADFTTFTDLQDIPDNSADWTYIDQGTSVSFRYNATATAAEFFSGANSNQRTVVLYEQILAASQYAEMVFQDGDTANTTLIGPMVKLQPNEDSYYALANLNTNSISLTKKLSGGTTSLGTYAHTMAPGHVMRLEVNDVSGVVNFQLDTGSGFVTRITYTDPTVLTGGKTGMLQFSFLSNTSVKISGFTAGDL